MCEKEKSAEEQAQEVSDVNLHRIELIGIECCMHCQVVIEFFEQRTECDGNHFSLAWIERGEGVRNRTDLSSVLRHRRHLVTLSLYLERRPLRLTPPPNRHQQARSPWCPHRESRGGSCWHGDSCREGRGSARQLTFNLWARRSDSFSSISCTYNE